MISSLNGYGMDKVYGTYYNRQGYNKNISNNYCIGNNYALFLFVDSLIKYVIIIEDLKKNVETSVKSIRLNKN